MKMPLRVLIVEDEPAVAELIAVNLRHAGFQPVCVGDGQTAQQEVDALLPDIILLDWTLARESGLVMMRRWRREPCMRRIPIVMLTARSGEADRALVMEAGADEYITKPFSPNFLLGRIHAVIQSRNFEQ